jgi:hypothetical protein
MNEERTRKYLREVEHIRGHLRQRYSITANQVMYIWKGFSFGHCKYFCSSWKLKDTEEVIRRK